MAEAWSLQTAESRVVICSCLTCTPRICTMLADPHQAELRLTFCPSGRESKRNQKPEQRETKQTLLPVCSVLFVNHPQHLAEKLIQSLLTEERKKLKAKRGKERDRDRENELTNWNLGGLDMCVRVSLCVHMCLCVPICVCLCVSVYRSIYSFFKFWNKYLLTT